MGRVECSAQWDRLIDETLRVERVMARLRRNMRTVFLALVAVGAFAWSAIHHFDVAPAEILDMLWMSLALLVVTMMLAVLAMGLRAMFRKRR